MPSRTNRRFNIRKYVNYALQPIIRKELMRDDLPLHEIETWIKDQLTQFIRFEYVRRNNEYYADWKEYCEYMSGNFTKAKRFGGWSECYSAIIEKWEIKEVHNPSKPLRYYRGNNVHSNHGPIKQNTSTQFSNIINLNNEYHGKQDEFPPDVPIQGFLDTFRFNVDDVGNVDWDKDKWELIAINKNKPKKYILSEIKKMLTTRSTGGNKTSLADHVKYLFFYDGYSKKINTHYKKKKDVFIAYHNREPTLNEEDNLRDPVNEAEIYINGKYSEIVSVIHSPKTVSDFFPV